MSNVDLPQKNEMKYLGMHLDRRLTRAKHIKSKRKQTQLKSETNALATRKIKTIDIKETPPTEGSTQPHMDLRNSAMGDSLQFQHRNPPALSIQDALIHSERTLLHKQPQGPIHRAVKNSNTFTRWDFSSVRLATQVMT
jgi:hypothetical protein